MGYTPHGLSATGAALQMLIEEAYGVEADQISEAPTWVNDEKYDIEAKVDTSVADELQKLSPDQRMLEKRRMLKELLADSFKLTLHRETRELRVYALVVAKNGPKLQEAKPGDTYPNGFKGPGGLGGGPGLWIIGNGKTETITSQGTPIASVMHLLSKQVGRAVLDKTGLTGKYDFTCSGASHRIQVPGDADV
jgi:uncharacterized protein (TIGR03435 family)